MGPIRPGWRAPEAGWWRGGVAGPRLAWGGRQGRRGAQRRVTGDAGSDERVRGGEERVAELVEVWVVLGGGLEQGERAAVAEARASVHGGREPGERDGRGPRPWILWNRWPRCLIQRYEGSEDWSIAVATASHRMTLCGQAGDAPSTGGWHHGARRSTGAAVAARHRLDHGHEQHVVS